MATAGAIAAGLLLGIGLVWMLWSRIGRRVDDPPADLQVRGILSVGEDHGRGNVVGVQPFMSPWDYATRSDSTPSWPAISRLAARRDGSTREQSSFPSTSAPGWWRPGRRNVYGRTPLKAMQTLVLSNPLFANLAVGRSPLRPKTGSSTASSASKPPHGQIYHAVFSRLARNSR